MNLPRLALGRLAPAQPPPAQPLEDRLRRDAQRRRGSLRRVAAVRPPRRVRIGTVDPGRRDAPPLAQQMHGLAPERRAARRHDPLGIERVRPAHRDTLRSEPWPEEWLLTEWPEGAEEPSRYWLSNLPPRTALKDLVHTPKARWRI